MSKCSFVGEVGVARLADTDRLLGGGQRNGVSSAGLAVYVPD